ncbi:pitrilysin family protein [Alicyclobacillus sp. SO9]|uniref:M16 family metallopeptidase n=1 Tax=Alicyclobacillus sp. SO9 TaxID=2665646 RepID=UPI0018E90810|nr:pitrilysin family protein [Alicyclobacillus sp. SO9]QQE80853.1 insulinase family protein [Alicyclobacillus sp. SO9]
MTYRRQLRNGVRIVGEHIPNLRSVSIGVWIGTGSRYETRENNGISHFLEHMLFKGTERRSARQLASAFDAIGGQVNAFTAKEYTCFYAKVLDEHFDTAADTLSDMLFQSTFDNMEMDKEKKVVIEEIRMYEDTPDELVMDLLAENVYMDHPLGYTILGQEDNLKGFSRSDILQYVADRYRPENVVIAVAGNVSEADTMEIMERYFDRDFPQPHITLSSRIERPSFKTGVNVRIKDTEQVHLSLASQGIEAGDPRLYALILLNNALGSAPSSRLFQEIREERGMAYSVFSFHSAYRDCGMFGVYAGTSPEYVDEVLSLIHSSCDDVAKTGLTDEELKQGKEQVKGSMMLSLESTSSRMSRLGKNELVLNREITLDETLAGINEVTNEDIISVARDVLGKKFAIAAVGPVDNVEFNKWQ